MIMRRLATLCLLCLAITVRSQDRGVLKVQDGVEVGYELQLLGKDEKRDRYRITVTATNKGGADIYYAVAKKAQPNGTSGLGRSDDRHFVEVMVNNPASFKDIFSANANWRASRHRRRRPATRSCSASRTGASSGGSSTS